MSYPTIDTGLLTFQEKMALADQLLASLHAEAEDAGDDLFIHELEIDREETVDVLRRVCDTWDELANAVTGFRV